MGQFKMSKRLKTSPLVALCVILVMGYAAADPPADPHHLQKRAPNIPFLPDEVVKLPLLLLLAEKSQGQGQGPPLPEHELMMNTPMNQGQMIEQSFSGPLALMGGFLILLSLGMAISYQQQANSLRRGININRRSSEARAVNHEYISSLMDTLVYAAQKWEQ